MITYCVWFDKFMQEIYALEKFEFEKYDQLKKCLAEEKNIIYYVEADSTTQAFEEYKKIQEQVPAFCYSKVIH